ncbi:MAG: hypothetical protein OYL97_04905 [Candidatus Poribacteria bacterium]|nr:hypothetical protein [Candidatus Poribacteria bacterium]
MQRLRVFLVQLANQNLLYKSRQFMPDMRVVKSPALKPYVGLITFSAASLAIALGITLSKILVFEYHSNSGVVGWLSANEYPKQQEYFFYLLALLGIPIVICLYWFGWCVFSRWCAERTAQPIQRVLKANALASIPLWLCWLQVYHIGQGILIGLLLPIGLSILLKLALLYLRYFPTLWNSDVSDDMGEAKNLASEKEGSLANEKGGNFANETDGASAPISYRTTKIWRGGLEYIILPIFIYLLTYSASIHGNIDLFHEGERLAPLNEMLRGGVPFRDIYIQHGLFQNAYLAWIGSQLFEPTLFGVRLMEDILAPLGYVALYVLGLQVFRSRFLVAFLCVVIASGTQFWVSPRHSLGLISFAFVANSLTHFQETRTNKVPTYVWKLLLAGLSTSFAFWYSTEVGLYTLGAIGLFLVIYVLQGGFGTESRGGRGYKPRQQVVRVTEYLGPLISYGCGVLVGFLSVGIYFLSHGALDDVIWNSYIQCRYQLATWGLAFPSLSKTLALLSTDGWHAFIFSEGFRWYLPICIFLIVAAYLTYRGLSGTHSANTMKLLLLLLGGIAFFRTALGRSDGGHLIYGATFLWLLCLFPLEGGIFSMFRALKGERPWHNALKAAWVLIPIAIFCWYVGEAHQPLAGFNGKWQRLRQNPFKQSTVAQELVRAGGVDIPDDQVEQIQKVVAYIKENTAENEKIFDFTSQGAYYFFANRLGVTRFHQVSYASTPAMQQEVIEALERDKTRLVIFKTGGWFDAVDGIRVEERHPLIAEYLQENYEPAVNINSTEILLRK